MGEHLTKILLLLGQDPTRTSVETIADARWLVARIVHRRDLERAVSTLT